jgi:cytosolic carboxypeptidase protein 2/3
MKICISKR